MKQEAEDIGLQWKDVAEYVTRQQTSDREERAAWRDAQKMKAQAEEKKRADGIPMAEIEDRKREDEFQAEKEKRADDIKIQIAQIEAAKELMYYKGHSKVMCVSSPVYPVIIGNMRGAHQMLPDPDWKAENQEETRARTSGGNNDDNDNQGGDMPSWMFKQESNRGKTKNREQRSQPRSRRMISVLIKILTSRGHHRRKVCCWTSVNKGSGEEER